MYDPPMPNARCRICRTTLPRGRRRYCTEVCVAEGRRRRRRRRPDRRSCAWCRKRFPRTRKRHRFCSDVCRKAAHRNEPVLRRLRLPSRRRALPEPQPVPAPTWLQIYTDAGHGEGAWWGAAVIYRHRYPPCAQPEPLAVLRGRIEPHYAGPTPAEGVAVVYALRWLEAARAQGIVAADEPVTLMQDNQAVASKLKTGSRWGAFSGVWSALAGLTHPLRQKCLLRVFWIRGGANVADAVARPHSEAEIWTVPEPE